MRSTILGILALLGLCAPVAAAQTGDAGPRGPRQSWTGDRREFAVGDVITVVVDEYTLATAQKGEVHSDRRARDLELGAGQTVSTRLPRTAGAEISSRNEAESHLRGEATRQNRFQAEIAVRVVAVESGGLLRVEGKKQLVVDRNQEELALRGFIRPEDVAPDNTVDSWRVGDAAVTFASRGGLGRPRGGIVSRLLGWVWP